MSHSEPRAYVEASALWNAIENRNDAKAASLALYDLSKLVEIPSPTRRSPLARAAELGFYETVKVALESGIHPDDPAFFPVPLLGLSKWYSDPKYVALALKHGASPDTCMTENVLAENMYPVARYLAYRLFKNSDGMNESLAVQKIESMAMILSAGSKTADADIGGARPVGPGLPSAAWFIASTSTRRPDLVKRLAALIPLLKAGGADIDTPCGAYGNNPANGSNDNPPIMVAVYRQNRVMTEAFIAAGAHTDDEHIVRSNQSGYPITKTFIAEVEENFGIKNSAWAREAIMRKVIADARIGVPIPEVNPVSPGARRHRSPGV